MLYRVPQKQRLMESNVSNFRWPASRIENHRHVGRAGYDDGLIKLVVNQPRVLQVSKLASMHNLPGS
jgi:hypothetical protein